MGSDNTTILINESRHPLLHEWKKLDEEKLRRVLISILKGELYIGAYRDETFAERLYYLAKIFQKEDLGFHNILQSSFLRIYEEYTKINFLRKIKKNEYDFLQQVVEYSELLEFNIPKHYSVSELSENWEEYVEQFNNSDSEKRPVIKCLIAHHLKICNAPSNNLDISFWWKFIDILPGIAISGIFKKDFQNGIEALEHLANNQGISKFITVFQIIYGGIEHLGNSIIKSYLQENIYELEPIVSNEFLNQFEFEEIYFSLPDFAEYAKDALKPTIEDIPTENYMEEVINIAMLNADVFDHMTFEYGYKNKILEKFNINLQLIENPVGFYDPSDIHSVLENAKKDVSTSFITVQPIENLKDNDKKVSFEYLAPINIYKGYDLFGSKSAVSGIEIVDESQSESLPNFIRHLFRQDGSQQVIWCFDRSAEKFFEDIIEPLAKIYNQKVSRRTPYTDEEKSNTLLLRKILDDEPGTWIIATGTTKALALSHGFKSLLTFDKIKKIASKFSNADLDKFNSNDFVARNLHTGLAVADIGKNTFKSSQKIRLAKCALFLGEFINNYPKEFTRFIIKEELTEKELEIGKFSWEHCVSQSIETAYDFLSADDIYNRVIGEREMEEYQFLNSYRLHPESIDDDFGFRRFFDQSFNKESHENYMDSYREYLKKTKELSKAIEHINNLPSTEFLNRFNLKIKKIRRRLADFDHSSADVILTGLVKDLDEELMNYTLS